MALPVVVNSLFRMRVSMSVAYCFPQSRFHDDIWFSIVKFDAAGGLPVTPEKLASRLPQKQL